MIYLVSELYYPEETSTGYILTKIAEGLAKSTPLQVITGPPDYSGYKAAPKLETRNNVRIVRVSSINLCKNKLTSRLLRSIILSVQLALKTLRLVKRGDTVFVVTNPAPLLVIMCLVCRVMGVSLVILTHDVFPENLQAAGLLRKDSFIFSLLTKIFKSIYRHADHIIVIGRDMEKIMREKVGGDKPDITVITNWADTDDVAPALRASNPIIKDLGLCDHFVVQFAGNIGRVQGIDQIVAAAKLVKDEKIHFLFIGNGARRNWLLEEVKIHELTNITILDPMPRSKQQIFLNACDVGIVTLAAGMVGLGVPSKAYNILAAGKPVVAVVDAASEIGLLVNEENLGWVVPPADSEQLAQALRQAASCKNLEEIGGRAREVAVSKYSLASIVDKYRQIIPKYELNR